MKTSAMEFPGAKLSFYPCVLFFVVIAVCTSNLIEATCPNTQILLGEKNVTDEVCLGEYGVSSCQDFAGSDDKNVSLLPLDNMRGGSIQRPSSIGVDAGYHLSPTGNYYPSIIVTMGSPSSSNARESVTGFLMYIVAKFKNGGGPTETTCAVLSIDHSKYVNDKLSFEYKMNEVSVVGEKYYKVNIYSLPLPNQPSDYMNDPENYQFSIVFTPKTIIKPRDLAYPQDWIPTIAIRVRERTIVVEFNLLRGELRTKFGFTNFTVQLLRPHLNSNDAYKATNVFIPVDSEKTMGTATFTDVPEDYYFVMVHVLDNFPGDPEKCLCHTIVTWFTKKKPECVSNCGKARSEYFDLSGQVYDELPPPKLTSTTKTSTQAGTTSMTSEPVETTAPPVVEGPSVDASVQDSGDSSTDTPVIIGASVGGVVLIIVLIVLLGYSRRRKSRSGKQFTHSPDLDPPPNIKVAELKAVTFKPPRKRVYLLYSPDHEYHQAMVKEFVIFLQKHCFCDVVEPSTSDSLHKLDSGGGAGWLADELNRCDYIIFLDSMGANRRLQAFIKPDSGERYVPLRMGPEGDLFKLGLKYVYNNLQDKSNQLILVSFTKEFSKNQLFKSDEYLLPKRLTAFLQCVHEIRTNQIGAYMYHLPLNQDCLPDLPEWMSFKNAIKEVQDYEAQCPNWFEKYFESETFKIDRPLSNPSDDDSGHGSFTGKRSASPPIDSSYHSSPTSDLDFPDFSERDEISCVTIETGIQDVGIQPPRFGTALNLDNFSVALRNFNQQVNVKEDKEKILPPRGGLISDRETGIKPPPRELDVNADTFSATLQNINQQTRSNSVRNKKRIVPPKMGALNEQNDNVSELLKAINFKDMHPSSSNSSPMMLSKNIHSEREGIKPPQPLGSQVASECSDTFSGMIRGINTRSKDDFIPSNNIEAQTKLDYENEENGSISTCGNSVTTYFV